MEAKKLAYSVHHKGRVYKAGSTAEEIGFMAGELGDHCWEGGQAPARHTIPGADGPAGGLTLGTRVVPSPSGLPGNSQGEDPVIEVLQPGNGFTFTETEPEPPHAPPAPTADTGAGDDVAPPASTGDGAGNSAPTAPAKKVAPRKATGTAAS